MEVFLIYNPIKRGINMRLKKTVVWMLVCALLIGCAAWAEDTLSVIMNAGTTQAFKEDAISEEDINAILMAGLNATSAINQQPWYFAVVTNKTVMEEISMIEEKVSFVK